MFTYATIKEKYEVSELRTMNRTLKKKDKTEGLTAFDLSAKFDHKLKVKCNT